MSAPVLPPDLALDGRAQREARGSVVVLPNRATLGLVAVVLAMLYAGVSQGNAAAYLLAFLLFGVAAVSALHTWNNLRELAVECGTVPPVYEGMAAQVPVRVQAGPGGRHSALEVRLGGDGGAVLIAKLDPAEAHTFAASLLQKSAGRYEELHWEISSRYPLGLFVGRRRGVAIQPMHVYPAPMGTLPPTSGAPGERAQGRSVAAEGEDFYGVREWRLGESMRHIDWKAVARGQELLTKQWRGGASARLVFAWAQVEHLPRATALRQLAQWVHQAERQGASYELRLPAQDLPAGRGEAHLQAAMRALAEMAEPVKEERPAAKGDRTRGPGPVPPVSRLALAALGGALLAAIWPMLEQAPWWTGLLVVISLFLRLRVPSLQSSKVGKLVRFVLLGVAFIALMRSYDPEVKLGTGFGILICLVSLKILEVRGERDLHVLQLLGYFISLCPLFFAQSLGRWCYAGLVLALVAAASVRYFMEARPAPWRAAWRTTAALLLQAAPLVLLLFLIFPRLRGEYRFFLSDSLMGGAGFKEQMQPGDLAAIARREEVAFQVKFPDGKVPPQEFMYWRGLVLWRGLGLAWERGPTLPPEWQNPSMSGAPGEPPRQAQLWRQIVNLQPHDSPWLFALDLPLPTATRGTRHEAGGNIRLIGKPVRFTTSYEAVSNLEAHYQELPKEHREAALEVQGTPTPAVLRLVAGLTAGTTKPQQVVDRALTYFRRGGFTYSLNPGTYPEEPLEEFLLRRRVGFCEHYAGAFTTLMRLAKVPARVVVGYLGGEYNPIGDYVIVRQSDAHAWSEVWLPELGWQRVDPTSVIAPMRMNFSLRNYLERQEDDGSALMQRLPMSYVWRTAYSQMRLFWDNLSYQWDQRVLSFDEDRQQAFLKLLGLSGIQGSKLLLLTLPMSLFILGGLMLWLRRKRRQPKDEVHRAAHRLEQRGTAAGLPRAPAEAVGAYTRRLAEAFPHAARHLHGIGKLYDAFRYGAAVAPAGELWRAVRQMPKLARPAPGAL